FGETTTITANGGVSYLWSNNANTAAISVSDNTPNTVTVTDVNGCTDSETFSVTINALPEAGADQYVPCYKNGVVTMNATGSGNWTAASGNPSFVSIQNRNA